MASTGDSPMVAEEIRKLGTIVSIKNIYDHPNADALAIAEVRGWKVIVNKERDGYKAGDKAIYVEIDTIVPEEILIGRAEHKILKEKKFRIKTAKIRGSLSQGILFPLEILPKGDYNIDDDVTEMLGLKKYVDTTLDVKCIARFPSQVPRTDAQRIQNLSAASFTGIEMYATEKLDGSSFTCFLTPEGDFQVCSRNFVVAPGTEFDEVATAMGLKEKLLSAKAFNIALQGELIGPKFQANRYNLKEPKVVIFNVYDISKQQCLPMKEAIAFVKSLKLTFVPVIIESVVFTEKDTIDSILQLAEGMSKLNGKVQREGLVFKSVGVVDVDGVQTTPSFKSISNKYLLKYEN
eukprot:TRINITY_DN748_c1_g1_i1.p1 TRINITY_DN748_c1_g1~~TRINITY_DN748_c1_g1_i1.p1  ORF type:complete len:367 (+),score=87.37 TRINITY_DN748_c1_g1_i1:57-1103(+)